MISMESDVWVTSSFCGNGACVKVMRTDAGVLVKSDWQFGKTSLFTDEEWAAFVRGVKAGEFDL